MRLRSRVPRRAPSGAGSGALIAAVAVLVLTIVAPAQAGEPACLGASPPVPAEDVTDQAGAPWAATQVGAAQARVARAGLSAGEGVTVAVLGSGIAVTAGLPVRARVDLPGVVVQPEVTDPTTTIVAGLVAGPPRPARAGEGDAAAPVGVAPAAQLVDVRLYDVGTAGDEAVGVVSTASTRSTPGARTLLIGLRHVADHPELGIDVVVVPEAVERDPAEAGGLVAVADELAQRGVVVVAATGDLPTEGHPWAARLLDDHARARPGLDAGPLLWPGGLPGVVAVASAEPGALPSSSTAVAAPTVGAWSVAPSSRTCVVTTASSAWAAAEVAGVVALLRTAYPDEAPRTTVERVLRTATGSGTPSRLTGAGVVQPLEALTRPLAPGPDGRLRLDRPVDDRSDERASRPGRPGDASAVARADTVRWGLLGGGALVVAALLRPVLPRRP